MRFTNELIAARDAFWRLEQTTSGFLLHDENRRGGARFTPLKDELRRSLDREADMKAKHPEYLEFHKWASHVDQLNRTAWLNWDAFQAALERDADAQFEFDGERL